ncbi:hypothetical protein MF271_04180 [Deinococcus sp. KNUC1210]|uniref:hypothetical protein n=1 Tax=Deinococcus sp. KNUC1210 TaxID=2917691 RepID=UPI001EF0C13B|nr:hypothetical protein [Deinococcus sp. KNUC1210]ULH15841.1 hypothetical protein MF271_04180 [Deinococcus sp. KNUC1210]
MKKLSLYVGLASLTAVLVACPQNSTTTPPTNPVLTAPTSISGTVQGWNGGTGAVELLASPYADKSASNPALSTGTISADGTFSVALPSAAGVTPYISDIVSQASSLLFFAPTSCNGNLPSSDGSARGTVVNLLDIRQNGSYSTSIAAIDLKDNSANNNLALDGTAKIWIYADRATTLNGTITCTTKGTNFNVTEYLNTNAVLSQGWNILSQTLNVSASANSSEVTVENHITATSDGSFSWNTVDLTAASLHASSIGKINLVQRAAVVRLIKR